MQEVSQAWKDAHTQTLLPETFVEITMSLVDEAASNSFSQYLPGHPESFSNHLNVINNREYSTQRHAFLEQNIWVLDGISSIISDLQSYTPVGYVNNGGYEKNIAFRALGSLIERTLVGFTIVWSNAYEEYATQFKLYVMRGNSLVGEIEVKNNTSVVSEIDLPIIDPYVSVGVTVNEWSIPNHRIRIDSVMFGRTVMFDKNSLLSFTHEQSGDERTTELPKNAIEFSIDNSDGRWNMMNPDGLEKFLYERQLIEVRYGMNLDGETEWIKGGKFYLSEWKAPANGLEAHFVARDVFEFMLNEKYRYDSTKTWHFRELVADALSVCDLPKDFSMQDIDWNWGNTVFFAPAGECSVAELLQLCSNAKSTEMYTNRDGTLIIEGVKSTESDYVISMFSAYSHPEFELEKPVKKVVVEVNSDWSGSDPTTLEVEIGTSGETIVVSNPLVADIDLANELYYEYKRYKRTETIRGDFRADPRLDLFDVVTVESKYGTIHPVLITNIKYTYNGFFRGTYTGKRLVT
jgi:hypothetical protein